MNDFSISAQDSMQIRAAGDGSVSWDSLSINIIMEKQGLSSLSHRIKNYLFVCYIEKLRKNAINGGYFISAMFLYAESSFCNRELAVIFSKIFTLDKTISQVIYDVRLK